ncbi:DMT family transporter [Thermomonas sp.]|uniref:DMT family transporter n=1 Tax=Thermomonas sp. TaxID=1971895 RepID=UPI0039E418D1
MKPAASPQLRAALLMLASMVAFAMMAISIRLASRTEPTLEVAFFRNAFGLLTLLPMLLWPVLREGGGHPLARFIASLRTAQLPRYFIRCGIGLASMFCGFWAIGHLPMAQAISLAYSSPIFITIAAAVWLGERVRMRRWLAVAAGFLGVLVVVRPWSHAFSIGTLIAVASAMTSAVVAIQIKQLSRVDKADTIVFWTYALWVPMSLLPALFVWHAPQGIAWLWLLLCGLLGTIGQLLWTRALKLGEVSALTPISFVQLPIVTFAGWLLFAERVDAMTLLGAGIILAATFYIAHREAALARKAASLAPSEAAKPNE